MRQASIIAIAAALSAGGVSAQYTNIHSPSWGEKSHAKLLASALGGTFNAATSKDFSNGDVYADRLKDSSYYSATDQVWQAGTYHATMVGREAAYKHTFGYVEGDKGNLGSFTGVLRSDEIGSSATVSLDDEFRWAIKNDSQYDHGHLFTSREKDNPGNDDHMTSYALLRNGAIFGYALFFEDLKNCPDSDYNDVAVILTLVPTPQAAMLGLTGLGGIGLMAGRRRRESI